MFGCSVTRKCHYLRWIRRIRKRGPVGVGVTLLEEVCLWGWFVGFEVSKSHIGAHHLFLPVDQDIVLTDCPSAYMHVTICSTTMIMNSDSETASKPQ